MFKQLLRLTILLLCACSTPQDSEAARPRPLRVLSYNIKHGYGMDGKIDLERVAALIRRLDPDLVTLQEVDRECTRSGGVDQAAWLGAACGMHPVFGAFMPYQGGDYGMAILSREPWIETENLRLPDGSEARTALAGRVLTHQGELIVVGIHLYNTEAERMAQAETLIEHFAGSEVPVLLAGDFNSQPGTAVMQRIALDWTLLDKSGPPLTFPSDVPDREIDFCLLRPATALQDHTLRVIDEPLISDHRPILLELQLR